MIANVVRAFYKPLKAWQDRVCRHRRDHPVSQLAELLSRARQVRIPPGPRLDIGAGEGMYRNLLEDRQVRVWEIDRRAGRHVQIVADAHGLPFSTNHAGGVVLVEVLEHLMEPWVALEECFRVLQPGGILAITTPQYWHVHGHPSDFFRFTDQGLRSLCERAGFTVIDCWSRGGPILILFHTIRVNLVHWLRPFFVIPFYPIADWLDRLTYTPCPTGTHYDALGWSLLAKKPEGIPVVPEYFLKEGESP